jgi:alpha/beta superfamily hydrolase
VGASEGAFDKGEGEKADFAAALDYMAAKYPGLPLWAAGFSFGSWVALEVGAADPRVSVLIGIAPPVATSVSGQQYDFTNTRESGKPKFFVQGEADEVCPLEGMWHFYGTLHEPKELVVIDAADHLFEGKTQEVGEALEDLLGDFDHGSQASHGHHG